MTAALEGDEWSAARPGRTLPPGMTGYQLYRRLGGPQGRSGRAENLVHTGFQFRTVQPVVSRYTDWATGPTVVFFKEYNIKYMYINLHVCMYVGAWVAHSVKQPGYGLDGLGFELRYGQDIFLFS